MRPIPSASSARRPGRPGCRPPPGSIRPRRPPIRRASRTRRVSNFTGPVSQTYCQVPLTGLIDLSIAQVVDSPDRWPLTTRQKELQADCYAGMFARYARDRGWLNPSDVDEAREALIRAGDDHVD